MLGCVFFDFFLPLILISITNSITPGPNNLLLSQIGANFGFKAGIPYSLGALSGRVFLQIILAISLAAAIKLISGIAFFVKIIGSCYMSYMSIMMFLMHKKKSKRILKIPRFKQGFIAQFLNPKAIMNIFTLLGLFFVESKTPLFNIVCIITVSGIASFSSGLIWVLFGVKIKSLLKTKKSQFIFNLTMLVLNIGCIGMIWF